MTGTEIMQILLILNTHRLRKMIKLSLHLYSLLFLSAMHEGNCKWSRGEVVTGCILPSKISSRF